jgi:GNAT superfamily N-acetyltransferase
MLEIRKAGQGDLEGLNQLYLQLTNGDHGLSSEFSVIFAQMQEDSSYHLMVAITEGNRVIGSLLGIICKSLAANYEAFLVIEDVIVDQEYRRAGVGRALFMKMDEIALENKCAYSILVSSGFRKEAHRFYESMGYSDSVLGFRKRFG